MKSFVFHITIGISLAFVGINASFGEEPQSAAESYSDNFEPALSEEQALETWAKIHEVFSHPRCANCHVPADNRPRWSGPSYANYYPQEGEPYHGMNINGGDSRHGEETIGCRTCHQVTNSPLLHGPPGSESWELAPLEMQWWNKTSREICEQIKNPETNGDRTLEDVADHITHDALVLWGWDPGPGRESAPYSPEEVERFILDWAEAGAPCPVH